MPTRFDFVSPGIILNEVDESILPAVVSDDLGPVIIGRSLSGPAMKPIRVKSLEDFNEIFGLGISGKGNKFNDIWRYGNLLGPTYAVYAAQAHLASESTPVTFLRLLGEKSDDAGTNAQYAGWSIDNSSNPSSNLNNNKSAYGLFITQDDNDSSTTGTLAAIFYVNSGSVSLSGTLAGGITGDNGLTTTASVGTLIESLGGSASKFKILIHDESGTQIESNTFDFDPGSAQYIRNQFNTNPQLLEANKNFGLSNKNYFLGETFEEAVARFGGNSTTAGHQRGIILALDSGSLNYGDHKIDLLPPKTGWFINREQSGKREKLFRLVSLHDGEWLQNNFTVVIRDLVLGNDIEPNSTFTIEIQNNQGDVVEQFSGLNLDPSSEKYISKVIGDQYFVWDSANTKYNVRGEYENNSNYVYVEVASAVTSQQLEDKHALPVGFFGPLRPKGFTLLNGSSGPHTFADRIQTAASAYTVDIEVGTSGSSNWLSGETLAITSGSITNTITFTSGAAGTTDSSFSTNAANVNVYKSSSAEVAALLDTLLASEYETTYDVSVASDTVTITAQTVGAELNLTFVDGTSGDLTITATDGANEGDGDTFANAFVVANNNVPFAGGSEFEFAKLPASYTGSFEFPSMRLTSQNSNSNGKNFSKTDIFGVRHHRTTATTRDDSYIDIARVLPSNASVTLTHHLGENESLPNTLEYSFQFSLDDLKQDPVNSNAYFFESGSYANGDSFVADSNKGDGDIKKLFEQKVRQFRAPFFGGHDGVDLKEVEPFSNKNLTDKTRKGSYAYNSVFKAIETVSDPEVVKYNSLAIPGITQTDVTDELIKLANDRQDHLCIIDLEGGYKPAYESNGSVVEGGINGTVTALEGRKINNSYVTAYYPWVRLRDRIGGQNDVLYVPPSVAAIGAMAKSQKQADLWFAPAGFNRGGINELGGSQGPIITGTWEHLTKDDRDVLYESNINPIARFPSMDQIVIFGQKTLLQSDSALNRINVRRLLIYLKYQIGLVADTILFDQNMSNTWNRFAFQAEAILGDVQDRLGISEFKLVLDTRTTTQDLIDRNIMYAKIFIKPTRSIEFIAVDFIISRSGVQF